MSQNLLQICCSSNFEGKKKKASKHNCLLAKKLQNEAEGARTLNLRIDSPIRGFVSICGKKIND
jgi:hypothetical protein